MFASTLPHLACPKKIKGGKTCAKSLALESPAPAAGEDIRSGWLKCSSCSARYPILSGVAVVVADWRDYLLGHAKGVARVVPMKELPKDLVSDFREALAEIQAEHIEEDLEADRVNALYVMNHYLHAQGGGGPASEWWKPAGAEFSPVIDRLVREYWDQGPAHQIQGWIEKLGASGASRKRLKMVELGSGVGGMLKRLSPFVDTYLGVDSSFASVALARHLALGTPYPHSIQIPQDLWAGPLTKTLHLSDARAEDPRMKKANADFVVGDLENAPLADGHFDGTIVMNAIDMLEDPTGLPRLQARLIGKGGFAIQSCPYIWHEMVLKKLRPKLPKAVRTSSQAVETLYESAGLAVEKSQEHCPWLFFKHFRQLEVYSVHLFLARKRT